MTPGPMKVGWANLSFIPSVELGGDDHSWAYDGHLVRFKHIDRNTFKYIYSCIDYILTLLISILYTVEKENILDLRKFLSFGF